MIDYLACQNVEYSYQQLIAIIEATIGFPIAILNEVRNGIKQLEVLIFNNLVALYDSNKSSYNGFPVTLILFFGTPA